MKFLFRGSIYFNCIFTQLRKLCLPKKNVCESNSQTSFSAIKAKIKMSGPVSVADYMKYILTNSVSGYYISRDVFGKEGDFITSPEISQIFGEMLAIWSLSEWQKVGLPKPLNIVELGPGRGSMMEDILRVYRKLKFHSFVNIHLVEISPELSHKQCSRLCENWNEFSDQKYYMKGVTRDNIEVFWYRSIQDVPTGFSCIFAHEFFDALPIHKFQRTKDGWREVLIDLDPSKEASLRYIISRAPTPASSLFTKNEKERDHIEVSPQSELIMQHLALRLEEHGGFMLIADYGHLGEKSDTFRGFRKHKLHDPLVDPGSADLTADVDFSYLKRAVGDKLITCGPISQHDFLKNMKIDVRLKILLRNCDNEESKTNLKSGYSFLMDKDKMGERFKFMAFFPAVLEEYFKHKPVAGFNPS